MKGSKDRGEREIEGNRRRGVRWSQPVEWI
jgi:hypothetical protein